MTTAGQEPGRRLPCLIGEHLDTWHEVIPVAVGGLLLLPLVPWIIPGLAGLDVAAARSLLSPRNRLELEAKALA